MTGGDPDTYASSALTCAPAVRHDSLRGVWSGTRPPAPPRVWRSPTTRPTAKPAPASSFRTRQPSRHRHSSVRPGASAECEYQRRRDARAQHARDKLGRLGGIYLTLSSDPQSQVAWARGSAGEKLLGEALERMHDEKRVVVLHDRRIPQIARTSITSRSPDPERSGRSTQRTTEGESTGSTRADGSPPTKQTEAIRSALGEPMSPSTTSRHGQRCASSMPSGLSSPSPCCSTASGLDGARRSANGMQRRAISTPIT